MIFETESLSSSEDDSPCEEILACSSVDRSLAIPSIDVSSDEPIAPHIHCLIQNPDLLNELNCFLLTKRRWRAKEQTSCWRFEFFSLSFKKFRLE